MTNLILSMQATISKVLNVQSIRQILTPCTFLTLKLSSCRDAAHPHDVCPKNIYIHECDRKRHQVAAQRSLSSKEFKSTLSRCKHRSVEGCCKKPVCFSFLMTSSVLTCSSVPVSLSGNVARCCLLTAALMRARQTP